jgi:microcystin-dependent protein
LAVTRRLTGAPATDLIGDRRPRLDRRGFLGACATAAVAAVAAACGGADVDSDSGPGVRARVASDPGRVEGLIDLSVGQLTRVAFEWAPAGMLACDGALVSVAESPELATLLGTTFGGDGTTTFGLPDLPARDGLRWLIGGQGWSFDTGQAAMVGEVRPMVVPPPTGSPLDTTWLPCDGRRLPIKRNEALYALMGTTFGGDGRVDFAVPDLAPLGGQLAWRISRLGQFPGTTCDAATPVFPNIVPLDAYLGSVAHLSYMDDLTPRLCGLALCRGQVLQLPQWVGLSTVIGDRFGGNLRSDTFALPTLPVDGRITPAIVVNGSYPERV